MEVVRAAKLLSQAPLPPNTVLPASPPASQPAPKKTTIVMSKHTLSPPGGAVSDRRRAKEVDWYLYNLFGGGLQLVRCKWLSQLSHREDQTE